MLKKVEFMVKYQQLWLPKFYCKKKFKKIKKKLNSLYEILKFHSWRVLFIYNKLLLPSFNLTVFLYIFVNVTF